MENEEIKNNISKIFLIFHLPLLLGIILIFSSFFYESGLLFYFIFTPLLALLFIFPKIVKYFFVNRKQDFFSVMKEQTNRNVDLSSFVLLWNYKFKRYLKALLFFISFFIMLVIPAIIIWFIYAVSINYGLIAVANPPQMISLMITYMRTGIGLFILWVTICGLVYLNINYASNLIGFPFLMRSLFRRLLRISDEYIYNSGLKEAKILLMITKEKIERKDPNWTKSFKNFLLLFQKTIKKEKNLIIPELDDVFKMIYGMKRIGSSSHLMKITEYIDSLDREMAEIEENERIEENIVSILSDFSNDTSLKNLKKFKRHQSTRETIRKKLTLERVFPIGISIIALIIYLIPRDLLSELWQEYLAPNWQSIIFIVSFLIASIIITRVVSPEDIEIEKILEERSRKGKFSNFSKGLFSKVKNLFKKMQKLKTR